MAELQLSRTRLAHTADEERRRLERDLHDSVQERLIAVQIRLGLAAENPTLDDAARRNLTEAIDGMEAAFNASNELYAELSAKSPKFKKIYENWRPFRNEEILWFRVCEGSFDNFMARMSAAEKL